MTVDHLRRSSREKAQMDTTSPAGLSANSLEEVSSAGYKKKGPCAATEGSVVSGAVTLVGVVPAYVVYLFAGSIGTRSALLCDLTWPDDGSTSP